MHHLRLLIPRLPRLFNTAKRDSPVQALFLQEKMLQKKNTKTIASPADFFNVGAPMTFTLRQNSALVCQGNWNQCYGLFVGRVLIY